MNHIAGDLKTAPRVSLSGIWYYEAMLATVQQFIDVTFVKHGEAFDPMDRVPYEQSDLMP